MDKDIKSLNNLIEENVTADKAFKNRLEKDLISQYSKKNPQTNFISSFFMKISPNIFKYGVISLSVLLVIASAAGTGYFAYNKYVRQPQIERDNELLAKIANSNPTANYGKESVTLNKGAASADQKISSMIAPEYMNRNFNYQKIVTQWNFGPKSDSCTLMLPYNGQMNKEVYTTYFVDKNEWMPSYSKYEAYIDSNIFDYNLTVKDTSWVYRGGSYAVKTVNNQRVYPMDGLKQGAEASSDDTVVSTEPVDPKPDTQTDPIKLRFGEDAKITRTVEIDGKKYYEIQWSYNISCSQIITKDSVSTVSDKIGVSVALVDSETFEFTKESLYLGSRNDSNLIYSKEINKDTQTVVLADVEKDFVFNESTNIKTFDASKFDYNTELKQEMVKYLNTKSLDLLTLEKTGYKLQSISSAFVTVIPDNQAYLVDRNFYSSLAYGQKQYEDNKNMFNPYIDESRTLPIVQLSYGNDTATNVNWLTLSQYDKVYSQNEIFTGLYLNSDLKKTSDITVVINGTEVQAGVYGINSYSSGSSDGTEVIPETKEIPITEYVIVFNFENRSYAVQTSTQKASAIQSVMNFKQVISSNTTVLNSELKVEYQPVDDVILMTK